MCTRLRNGRERWNFEIDERLEQPFMLEMITPSGRFQPLHSAQVKLDGPPFGSVVLTIRGTLVEADDEQSTRKR
jgi:hypothetical protein